MKNSYALLFLFLLISGTSQAQIFWSEDFGTTCRIHGHAAGFTGVNGPWTVTATGVNEAQANEWYINDRISFNGVGNCAKGWNTTCGSPTNNSLHLGGVANPNMGVAEDSASYWTGYYCSFNGFCSITNKRVESPVIDCRGQGDISVDFVYYEGGDVSNGSPNGDATFMYYNGSYWTVISDLAKTPRTCGANMYGIFNSFHIELPPTADNNPNVKIGINWTNDGIVHGTDPSFAIDNIRLTANVAAQYNTIKGKCFLDYNNDLVQNNGEPGFPDMTMKSDAYMYSKITKTDSLGSFVFHTPDTGYIVTYITNASSIYTVTPSLLTSHFTGLNEIDSVEFALLPTPGIRDIRMTMIPLGVSRAGGIVTYAIEYYNIGTDTVDAGEVTLIKDHNLSPVSAVPQADYELLDTVRWLYTDLKPFDKRRITVTLHVSALAARGMPLHSEAILTPLTPNTYPTENYAYVNDVVTGSFDPNDKQSLFGETITTQQLNDGQYLTYLVRFQNTGTDTAFNVVVRDTLDGKFDVSKFELISSSHPCEISIGGWQELIFNFSNIRLPDSSVDEPASHGYLSYRVQPYSFLAAGEVIKNTAYIYFDANAAVVTNTAITTVAFPVPVQETGKPGSMLRLYPNPAGDKLTIYSEKVFSKEAVTISIMNMLGEVMMTEKLKWNGNTSIPVKTLPSGIYFLELKGESGKVVERFVKE